MLINNINAGDTVGISLKINQVIPSDAVFIVTSTSTSYLLAKKLDPSIEATHISNLPNLDPAVSKDPKTLTYIVLQYMDSMEELVLALDWIQSITVTDSSDYNISITNGTPEEMEVVRLLLNNIGLGNRFVIEKK